MDGDDMPLYITEYQFRPVRKEHVRDWYLWIVKVVPMDIEADDWVVQSMFEWLDADGNWVWDRTDAWRGTLAAALERGVQAQWTLQVNSLTAQDILDRVDQGEFDED